MRVFEHGQVLTAIQLHGKLGRQLMQMRRAFEHLEDLPGQRPGIQQHGRIAPGQRAQHQVADIVASRLARAKASRQQMLDQRGVLLVYLQHGAMHRACQHRFTIDHLAHIEDARLARVLRRVAALSQDLGVSTETVRRDIRALVDAGAAVRVHGAVGLAGQTGEAPFDRRMRENAGAKRAIARSLAEQIADGDKSASSNSRAFGRLNGSIASDRIGHEGGQPWQSEGRSEGAEDKAATIHVRGGRSGMWSYFALYRLPDASLSLAFGESF